MMKLILLLVVAISITSCFKTAEEIKREKKIDQRLAQSSKLVTDLSSQVQGLQTQLALATGQLEEMDHKTKQNNLEKAQSIGENLNQLNEQVKVILTENRQIKKQIAGLQQDINSQKKYIKKVTGALSSVASTNSKSTSSGELKKAHKAFEKGRKNTKSLYLAVLGEGKINNAQKNHVYFNLGLLDYRSKKYEKALVYFSKIYTRYPKSSFSPRSLLYIARSFKSLNKPEEANVSYQELINKYPKSKHAKTAKKEIK